MIVYIWNCDGVNIACNRCSFGGPPVSCAAALAVLDVFESERLCERSAEVDWCFLCFFFRITTGFSLGRCTHACTIVEVATTIPQRDR